MYIINKFYVLAGDSNQARYYFRDRNIKYDFRKVVNNVCSLRGRLAGVLICTGTYYKRRDIGYIMNAAKAQGFTIIYDDRKGVILTEKIKYDWLVCRLWGKIVEKTEICLLTTRGFILARHIRDHIRLNLNSKGRLVKFYKPIAGLRRYRTEEGADKKAVQLNKKFKTSGYKSIREDQI